MTLKMKYLLTLLLLTCQISHAQMSVYAIWDGDSSFEATLFNESDHCPSGFKAATVGRKSAPFTNVGCWRFSADKKTVEITRTHKMDRRTLNTTPVQPESQGVPFTSFKVKR